MCVRSYVHFSIHGLNYCRVMRSMSVPELPPLVFQLLGLSTKGHRVLVLEGLKTLFNHLDQEILTEKEDAGM